MKRIPDRQFTYRDLMRLIKSPFWRPNSRWSAIKSNMAVIAAYDGFAIYWEKLS